MQSRKWLNMHSLCLWPVADLEYDGCCSHVRLSEKLLGDTSNLNPEQIEAAEQARLEASRAYQRDRYHADKARKPPEWLVARFATIAKSKDNTRDSGRLRCDLCRVTFEGPCDQRRHEATDKHKAKVAGLVRPSARPSAKALRDANIASKRYYCPTCKVPFGTQQAITKHLKSKVHARRLARCAGPLASR